MADVVADLGKTIFDYTLVLNVIRSLNEKFAYISRHLC